jgi:hypothetical protein
MVTNKNAFDQAADRVALRHLQALSEERAFVVEIEKALDTMKDAIDIATFRTSDNPETGEALADWNSNVAHAVKVIRDFSGEIAPILRRIR